MTHAPDRVVVAAAGFAAAAISLLQFVVGFAVVGAVTRAEPGDVGSLSRLLDRLDGLKMLLLVVVAAATFRAIRHARMPLPRWVGGLAAFTAVTIALSNVGLSPPGGHARRGRLGLAALVARLRHRLGVPGRSKVSAGPAVEVEDESRSRRGAPHEAKMMPHPQISQG